MVDSNVWLKTMGALLGCSEAAIKMAAGYISNMEPNIQHKEGRGVCKVCMMKSVGVF